MSSDYKYGKMVKELSNDVFRNLKRSFDNTKEENDLKAENKNKGILSAHQIKKRLQDALNVQEKNDSDKEIFSNISDFLIEKNIPVALESIRRNTAKNSVIKSKVKELPNLVGGLATFYAAAEEGNRTAANKAYQLAYTDTNQLQKNKQDNIIQQISAPFKSEETEKNKSPIGILNENYQKFFPNSNNPLYSLQDEAINA